MIRNIFTEYATSKLNLLLYEVRLVSCSKHMVLTGDMARTIWRLSLHFCTKKDQQVSLVGTRPAFVTASCREPVSASFSDES